MIVTRQKSIQFNNECKCLVDYALLEQAILWFQKKPTAANKKIYLHARYPAVSIHDTKIHVHRLLMMHKTNSMHIPNMHVHHKDGDKLNASINNLELKSPSEHLSNHNKGRKLTASHKHKIGLAGKRRVGMKLKRKYSIDVSDMLRILNKKATINSIAKKYNCDWSVIKRRVDENANHLPQ